MADEKINNTTAAAGVWLDRLAPALDTVRTWAALADHEALVQTLRQCETQTRAYALRPEVMADVGFVEYRRDRYLRHAAEAMRVCAEAIEAAILDAALIEARLADPGASAPAEAAGAHAGASL